MSRTDEANTRRQVTSSGWLASTTAAAVASLFVFVGTSALVPALAATAGTARSSTQVAADKTAHPSTLDQGYFQVGPYCPDYAWR